MATEGEAIIFYCCNLFIFFVLSLLMKDQPWDLNQTWSVGRKWCQFTNAFPRTFPQNFGRKKHQILGAKKRHILDDIFCDFRTRHRISPERNIAWTNKNASVNLHCVPYKVTYSLWSYSAHWNSENFRLGEILLNMQLVAVWCDVVPLVHTSQLLLQRLKLCFSGYVNKYPELKTLPKVKEKLVWSLSTGIRDL